MPARPSHPTPNARDDREASLLVAAGCAKINHEFPKNGRQLFCNQALEMSDPFESARKLHVSVPGNSTSLSY
jgi:hypothetical protein